MDEHRPLLPGVQHALQLCQEQGFRIGLASAESLPFSKPHPQVYLNAAQALDISPLHCVTLEDAVNGMIATKAARMRSIVVPRNVHAQDPRWVLADKKLNSLQALTLDDLTGH